MRTLTPSEKLILLGIFGGAAFVVLNFFLFGIVEEKKAALVQSRTTLEQRIFQLEEMQKERDEWLSKRMWVSSKLPMYQSVNDRETFLISMVNSAAASAGVDVTNGPNQIPGSQGDYFEETGVSATVTGTIEGVMRWVFSLQDPDSFRAITSVKIDAPKKGDPTEISCEVTLVQWWSPDSAAIAGVGDGGPQAPAPAPEQEAAPSTADAAPPADPGESDPLGAEASPVDVTVPGASEAATDESVAAVRARIDQAMQQARARLVAPTAAAAAETEPDAVEEAAGEGATGDPAEETPPERRVVLPPGGL